MPIDQFAAEMKAEFGLPDTTDSMLFDGTVINGVVVLGGSQQLPEGQHVFVDLVSEDSERQIEYVFDNIERKLTSHSDQEVQPAR